MLQKIRRVRQDVADRERHWFQDDFFDLFAADRFAAEFDRRSAAIDPHWRRFIRRKINEAAIQLPVPKNPS